MANGLPSKAKVGIPGESVNVNPAIYFLATRMEKAGMLKRGQALMLAATLPSVTKRSLPKRTRK